MDVIVNDPAPFQDRFRELEHLHHALSDIRRMLRQGIDGTRWSGVFATRTTGNIFSLTSELARLTREVEDAMDAFRRYIRDVEQRRHEIADIERRVHRWANSWRPPPPPPAGFLMPAVKKFDWSDPALYKPFPPSYSERWYMLRDTLYRRGIRV